MQQAEFDPEEIKKLTGGYHRDPFSILGPHEVVGGWQVRALLPRAQSVQVLLGGSAIPMTRNDAGGLFTADLPLPLRHDYRLRITPLIGDVHDIEDPYRFPLQLTPDEIHYHAEGTHFETYGTLGAHLRSSENVPGVLFAVWAPNAEVVSVVGLFNDWDSKRHPMRHLDGGLWELFLPGLTVGTLYKYAIKSPGGRIQLKSDPCGYSHEVPPKTASIVFDPTTYHWNDAQWLVQREKTDPLKAPISVYEVHLESWLRKPDHQPLSYRELAQSLVAYVKDMGYTHIELMPIMEFPYSGSWGYQVTGFYAPTSRFGGPDDFKYFIDQCHQNNIGIIVDWVPGHFPKDAHGLAQFDGTALYEHADPRQGEHKEWGTLIFNYGRAEVKAFLISNALFWLREYHIDGLRVDAVASMLYNDYSRKAGEWIPNQYGGRENLEAIEFLKKFNELAHQVPGIMTLAEESTAFPNVSRPLYLGGLGFTMKWNMGWMHDMFKYFSADPVYRKYNHNHVTFSLLYAFTENFLLPISHDEVVHGKASLISKMPGDEWRRFANVRTFLSYMYGHPGKKLLFMGCEIGQTTEWNYQSSVSWDLLNFPIHRGLQTLVRDLNRLYANEPALYEVDFHWDGFQWVDLNDIENSVISFLRFSQDRQQRILFVCNFTPVVRRDYKINVEDDGFYRQILNSDDSRYGGSGVGGVDGIWAEPNRHLGKPYVLNFTLPPLAVMAFRLEGRPS